MCLFKCIRGLVSENPLAVNVLGSPKTSWNLQKSTFIQLFDHSKQKWVRRSYFWLDLRLQDCLLTCRLSTKSILVRMERIYTYQFISNYLKNHQFFAVFFSLIFGINIKFPIFWKKMSLRDRVFLKLFASKDVLIQMHNRACFWKPFFSEHIKQS